MTDRLHVASHPPEPVLLIGPVAFDSIITPTQEGERVLGGAAAFAALASSYFTESRLVSLVGDDFDKFRKKLIKYHFSST